MTSGKNIFISYARKDGNEYASSLYDQLRIRGYHPWRDVRNINNYADFSVEIEKAIEESDVVVVVLTPDVKRDVTSFVRREILYAQAMSKPIFPLQMPNFDQAVPILINHLTCIPFADPDTGLDALIQNIEVNTVFVSPPQRPDKHRSYVVKLRNSVVEQLRQAIPVGDQLIQVKHIVRSKLVSQPAAMAYEGDDNDDEAIFKRRERNLNANTTILDVLSDETYEQRVLVVGDPGAGKTTMLLAFTREMVNRRLADPNAMLPLFAPIRLWQPGSSLVSFLVDVTGITEKDIDTLIDSNRAILILDGLDELPRRYDEDERVLFMRMISDFMEIPALRETPTIVTCRERDYNEIIAAADGQRIALNGAVALRRLETEQILHYLGQYPKLQAIIEGDPRIASIIHTPLVLHMVVAAFRDAEASELRNLLEHGQATNVFYDNLFQTYINRMWEHERKRRLDQTLPYTVEEIYKLLGQVIAQEVQTNITAAAERRTNAFKAVDSAKDAEDVISALIKFVTVILSPDNYFSSNYDPNVLSYRSFLEILGDEAANDFINLVGRDQLNIIKGSKDNGYWFFHPMVQDHVAVVYMSQSINKINNLTELMMAQAALISISDHGFDDRVRPLLNDSDPGKSTMAALALAIMGDKSVGEPFIQSLQPDRTNLALFGLIGLFLLGDRATVAQARDKLRRMITYEGDYRLIGFSYISDDICRYLSGILLSWVMDWGVALQLVQEAIVTSNMNTRAAITIALTMGAWHARLQQAQPKQADMLEEGIRVLIEKHGRMLLARGRSLEGLNQRHLLTGS